jgi:hypothetical protein
MYKYLIGLIILLSSCHSLRHSRHSFSLIESALDKGQEIKINVVRDGDLFTAPDDHYEISIVKKDSLYSSTCFERGTKTYRILSKIQMLKLADFEKEMLRKNYSAGLCNISATIIVDGKHNSFNISCSADNALNTLRR